MPTTRTTSSRFILRGLSVLAIALIANPAAAIVIRHDRDDARYVELGNRFPAAVTVLPDGTGVLIAPDWVLTAGHVARGVARRSPQVQIGDRKHDVARIFIHPDWSDQQPHDIALLKLEQPAQRVTPAKLYADSDEAGQVVTFVGRGDSGNGKTGPTNQDGKKRGATNTITSVDDNWIFFDFNEGDAATDLEGVSGPGDSGGPALVTRDGQLYTLGVSVFSRGDGSGPGRYGVVEGYTRVSTHRDWIESVVSGKSTAGEIAPAARGVRKSGPSADRGKRKGQGRGKAIAVPVATRGPAELPDSPFGLLVGEYVEAYNSNDDSAMSAFIVAGFDESFRETRSEKEHIERYRRLFDEHFGPITVRQVVGDDDEALTVLFESAKGPMAEFRFERSPGEPKQIAGMRVAIVDVSAGP